ncbi:MAG: shikimate kinase [Oscillospiraceae bacterium]|nr:shikimate kinase [Oscillospiraceae bacterium]
MKVVFIMGNSAVGKMTVGQELTKITELSLFHNHMMIEPVIEIFQEFRMDIVAKLRMTIFEEFAASGKYGMIFTFMMAFDHQEDWDYLEKIKNVFLPYGAEFFYVELVAPQKVRLERNHTENRLSNKPSKRDLGFSDKLLLEADTKYRCESYEGEFPFPNYLRVENTDLSAAATAQRIKEFFAL